MKRLKHLVALSLLLSLVPAVRAESTEIKVLEQTGPKCATYCVRSKGGDYQEMTNRDEIVELVISRGIDEVPEGLFAGLTNLQSVTIEENPRIGPRAFADCPKLNCVFADDLDLVKLPYDAFSGCARDCVRVHRARGRAYFEMKPLYGFWRDVWLPMSESVKGVKRTKEAFYGRSGNSLTFLRYTGSGRKVNIPAEVDGLSVTGFDRRAFTYDQEIETLVLPASLTDLVDEWPGVGTNGLSKIDLIFCEGPVPTGLHSENVAGQRRLICSRVPSHRTDVMWTPSWMTTHDACLMAREPEENESFIYWYSAGRIGLLAVKDPTPQELLVLPERIGDNRVLSVAPALLKGRTPRTVRLPVAMRGNWLIDPAVFGESVRDLHDRFVKPHPKWVIPGGPDWFEDVTQQECDRWLELRRFSGWQLLDAKGDYARAFREIEKEANGGAISALYALENYYRYGRPGLYDIKDDAKAREIAARLRLSRLNEGAVFCCDENGKDLPDWRQPLSDEERAFWLRYRAIRGDREARKLLLAGTTIPPLKPERGEAEPKEPKEEKPKEEEPPAPKVVIGETPGYGRPGQLEAYAADEDLSTQCAAFGFAPLWYERMAMEKDDPRYLGYVRRIERGSSGERVDCLGATVARIPCLFSDGSAEGATNALPLVVYLAGSGEQGTDLHRMFRQTAVFKAVRDPQFQAKHPCHLLAIMPPHFANHSAYRGGPTIIPPDLQELYADLIFDLNRDLAAKGRQPIRIDRTALVGLGSGATAAAALACVFPGRYAGVCAMMNAPDSYTYAKYAKGRWWFITPTSWKITEAEADAVADKIRATGAEIRQDFCEDGGPNWWDPVFISEAFRSWLAECFEKGPVQGVGQGR